MMLPFLYLCIGHIAALIHPSQFSPSPEKGLVSSRTQLPDWSEVEFRGPPRQLRILMAVDASVSRFYGHDRDKIVSGMTSYMHAVNMYVYQLNLRIQLVDVVAVRGNNLTLDDFLEWRSEAPKLALHDLAFLVRYRYEGGIAYVNGICTPNSVGIVGVPKHESPPECRRRPLQGTRSGSVIFASWRFLPESPFEYSSVFVHELAHLLGLSHSTTVQCSCKNKRECLRIDGFDSDCSAQALVDRLPSLKCLANTTSSQPRTTVSICGNGVLEDGEDCDCGPQRFCDNLLCEPRSCQFIFPKKYLYTTFTFGAACTIFLIFYITKQLCCSKTSKDTKLLLDDCEKSERRTPIMKSASTETTLVDIDELTTRKSNRKTRTNKLPVITSVCKFPISLDRPIELPSNMVNDDEYMKMYKPGTQQRKEIKVLTPLSKSDISEPIPQIVAGKPYKQHMQENESKMKVPSVPSPTLKPQLILP